MTFKYLTIIIGRHSSFDFKVVMKRHSRKYFCVENNEKCYLLLLFSLSTFVDINYEDLYLLTNTSGFEPWRCHVRRKISTSL